MWNGKNGKKTKLWGDYITLKNYKKQSARSPAPVLTTWVYTFIARQKVTSTTIHGHAGVPLSPCVVVVNILGRYVRQFLHKTLRKIYYHFKVFWSAKSLDIRIPWLFLRPTLDYFNNLILIVTRHLIG